MGKNETVGESTDRKIENKKIMSKTSDFGVAFCPVMVFNRPFIQSIAECKFPKISEFFFNQKTPKKIRILHS